MNTQFGFVFFLEGEKGEDVVKQNSVEAVGENYLFPLPLKCQNSSSFLYLIRMQIAKFPITLLRV